MQWGLQRGLPNSHVWVPEKVGELEYAWVQQSLQVLASLGLSGDALERAWQRFWEEIRGGRPAGSRFGFASALQTAFVQLREEGQEPVTLSALGSSLQLPELGVKVGKSSLFSNLLDTRDSLTIPHVAPGYH